MLRVPKFFFSKRSELGAKKNAVTIPGSWQLESMQLYFQNEELYVIAEGLVEMVERIAPWAR